MLAELNGNPFALQSKKGSETKNRFTAFLYHVIVRQTQINRRLADVVYTSEKRRIFGCTAFRLLKDSKGTLNLLPAIVQAATA